MSNNEVLLQKKEDKPDWKAEMKGEKVEKVSDILFEGNIYDFSCNSLNE